MFSYFPISMECGLPCDMHLALKLSSQPPPLPRPIIPMHFPHIDLPRFPAPYLRLAGALRHRHILGSTLCANDVPQMGLFGLVSLASAQLIGEFPERVKAVMVFMVW